MLESSLWAEGVEEAGSGSVIKVERGLLLPHPGLGRPSGGRCRDSARRGDDDGQSGRGVNSFSLAG